MFIKEFRALIESLESIYSQDRETVYGCRLVNYGLYPSITDAKTGETLHFLHYFD